MTLRFLERLPSTGYGLRAARYPHTIRAPCICIRPLPLLHARLNIMQQLVPRSPHGGRHGRKHLFVEKLARNLGVTVRQLREWNGLRGNNIRAGRRLKIYR